MPFKRWFVPLLLLILLTGAAGHAHQASAASDPKGGAAYAQGLAADKVHDYAAAAADFEEALLHGYTGPDTFYRLGLAYRALKRLNDAAWALSVAVGDPVFAALTPDAVTVLSAVGAAGGTVAAPPARLRGVKETAATVTPAIVAQAESRSAASALTAGSTYFVAPAFGRSVSASTVSLLSQAAADLQNNSTTKVKFVFLSAIPAPYAEMSSYAADLFAALHLQRAVVVVVTPATVAAYSDRITAAGATSVAQQQLHTLGVTNPAQLAAAVARLVTSKADDADAANTRHSAILGILFAVIIFSGVAGAIWLLLRRDTALPGRRGAGVSGMPGARSR